MRENTFLQVRLPMYDWPEVRDATAHLESALQGALSGVLGLAPAELRTWPATDDLEDVWRHPDLLLTQTCGYPLTHALAGKVRVLGAPIYTAEGCDGPNYCSQLVVHSDSRFQSLDQLRGRRAVYNGSDSQSGMNAFRDAVAQLTSGRLFFSALVQSGSHLGSMKAVAAGEADIACIDAVCWGLARRELPELTASLRPIGQTASVPGLPFITSLRFSDAEAEVIADTVETVLTAPETAKSRERLGIRGFSKLDVSDYSGILAMESQAAALGYPELA